MIRKMISYSNRRRLVRFSLIRQQLCPICGNIVCFCNKQNTFKCKNEECSFKESKTSPLTETDEIFIIENEIKSSL